MACLVCFPKAAVAKTANEEDVYEAAVLDKWDAMVGERGEVQRWVEALPIARDRLATS